MQKTQIKFAYIQLSHYLCAKKNTKTFINYEKFCICYEMA